MCASSPPSHLLFLAHRTGYPPNIEQKPSKYGPSTHIQQYYLPSTPGRLAKVSCPPWPACTTPIRPGRHHHLPCLEEDPDQDTPRRVGRKVRGDRASQFGKDGFDDAVERITRIEQSLGIADLGHYTASPP